MHVLCQFINCKSENYLNQSKYSTYAEDSDDSEERGRHGQIHHHVLHDNAQNRGHHQYKIKQVPRHREVMVPQTNNFHYRLCKKIALINIGLSPQVPKKLPRPKTVVKKALLTSSTKRTVCVWS
jgi:hypothetical protein